MDSPYQISYATKADGNGKVYETSLLLNLRGESLPLVVTNFQTLRNRLNGSFAEQPEEVAPAVQVMDRKEASDRCPQCGKGLIVEKLARKGPRAGTTFRACSLFGRTGCTFIQQV